MTVESVVRSRRLPADLLLLVVLLFLPVASGILPLSLLDQLLVPPATNKRFKKKSSIIMDSNPSDVPRIPILSQPMAVLVPGGTGGGLNSNRLSSVALAPHPVAHLQSSTALENKHNNPYRDLTHVRQVYGSALAMRLATERQVAREQAMQGRYYLQASSSGGGGGALYGEICSGTDVQLHFEDVLGRPDDRPDLPSVNPHAVLERQLNMTM